MHSNWQSEPTTKSIVETGYKHVFTAETPSFMAFAYPAEFGPLKHIYQNGLYEFDLLSSFIKKEVVLDGIKCYQYKFPDETFLENDTFEFLWKDKK